MKKAGILTFALLFIGWGMSYGLDLPESKLELEIQSLKTGGADLMGSHLSVDEEYDEFATEFDDGGIFDYEYKAPKKAFLYSLVVPGWGQMYTKSSIWKPLVMLGLEVGSWAGYIIYHKDGNDLTDEYEAFADLHWIEGDRGDSLDYSIDLENPNYWDWFYTMTGDDNSGIPTTETLPEGRSQQYYEMIGKYDQFVGGWDDYWTVNEELFSGGITYIGSVLNTPNRIKYNDMRGKANDKLDAANNFILVAMANHLISAFDAALAANRFNKRNSEESWLSVRTDMKKYSATEKMPIVRLTYHF